MTNISKIYDLSTIYLIIIEHDELSVSFYENFDEYRNHQTFQITFTKENVWRIIDEFTVFSCSHCKWNLIARIR